MTTEQVQHLLRGLLTNERAGETSAIKGVTTIGSSHVVITFTDGAMARLDITVAPAPEGGQE